MDAGTPQPVANTLGALPVELLYRIARHLSTTELCALRLSCRDVERSLFHSFSREFFSRKQFMASEIGLQALLDISLHPNLSQKLEHVSFGDDTLSMPQSFPTYEQERMYRRVMADQITMFSSGRALDMMTEAFAHLSNLKTVSIRDSRSRTRYRDFNSGLKYWNSYGYPTLLRRIGVLEYRADETFIKRIDFATSLFCAAMAALVRSGSRPESIEVMLGRDKRGLADECFWLSPRTADSYTAMLAGIRKLHLVVELQWCTNEIADDLLWDPRLQREPPDLDMEGMRTGINCCQFIGRTSPSLKWLRINFRECELETTDDFMTFFSNPTASPNKEDHVVLPKLQRLDLGRAHVAVSSLFAMLRALPRIETLCLHKVWLATRAPVEEGRFDWKTLLRGLPSILPNLRRLEINDARQYDDRVVLDKNVTCIIVQVKDGDDPQELFSSFAERLTVAPKNGAMITAWSYVSHGIDYTGGEEFAEEIAEENTEENTEENAEEDGEEDDEEVDDGVALN